MATKICNWHGCQEQITGKGNIKYCQLHQREAQRERWRNRSRLYYQNNKKRKKLSQVGTSTNKKNTNFKPGPTYLGKYIPFHQFYTEYLEVSKLKLQTFSKSVRMKYEEMELKGTHQYITADDYHYFNITYTLTAPYNCPHCEKTPEIKTFTKDLKHCETVCSHCGHILSSPYLHDDDGKGGRMAFNNIDIYQSQPDKKKGQAVEMKAVQQVAWKRYWAESGGVLNE